MEGTPAGSGCGNQGCGCGTPIPTSGPAAIALSKLPLGTEARVCEACVHPSDAAMLRAMGLRPNAVVRVCRVGSPCIVEVVTRTASGAEPCACRIGLAGPIAARVMVQPQAPVGQPTSGPRAPDHP